MNDSALDSQGSKDEAASCHQGCARVEPNEGGTHHLPRKERPSRTNMSLDHLPRAHCPSFSVP